VISIEVFEDGVPPRWRIRNERGQGWSASDVTVVTERPDGARQAFTFVDRGGYLESADAIPEPHQFIARVSLGHAGHTHDYDLSFVEGHGHDHLHEELRGLDVSTGGYQDAHELAHANDIRRQFADRKVTTWQIVLFGLTGGLIPCPAAITVLLLCLQLKEFTVGFALVLCFSIGLALTLIAVGAAAALSVRHATARWSWFGTFARRAPYASAALIIVVGLYVGYTGWSGLAQRTAQVPAQALMLALN
jgi:nickel/cobalt exporter